MVEPAFLTATRESYSVAAAEFAAHFAADPAARQLERALVGVFAERVRAGGGLVVDVGCGAGIWTRLLAELGLDVLGVDLAPGMVELARGACPGLRFEVGSMLDLDLPDGSVGGVLASYSVIHVPWALRAAVFAEFARVLAPGGHLMLVFQVGDDVNHRDEAFGHRICLDWHRQQPGELVELLERAGFEPWMQAVALPEGEQRTPQGHLIVRKPG